jgi:hypothetical protein
LAYLNIARDFNEEIGVIKQGGSSVYDQIHVRTESTKKPVSKVVKTQSKPIIIQSNNKVSVKKVVENDVIGIIEKEVIKKAGILIKEKPLVKNEVKEFIKDVEKVGKDIAIKELEVKIADKKIFIKTAPPEKQVKVVEQIEQLKEVLTEVKKKVSVKNDNVTSKVSTPISVNVENESSQKNNYLVWVVAVIILFFIKKK